MRKRFRKYTKRYSSWPIGGVTHRWSCGAYGRLSRLQCRCYFQAREIKEGDRIPEYKRNIANKRGRAIRMGAKYIPTIREGALYIHVCLSRKAETPGYALGLYKLRTQRTTDDAGLVGRSVLDGVNGAAQAFFDVSSGAGLYFAVVITRSNVVRA